MLPLSAVRATIASGFLNALIPVYRDKYDKSTYEIVHELTANAELRTVFCHLYMVLCTSPRNLTFPILAGGFHHYNSCGEFYPVGGFSEIPLSLASIVERAGGRVMVKADVQEILFSGTKAVGVRVSNRDQVHDILAPVIVSSPGLHNTFRRLVPREVAVKSPLYEIQETVLPSRGVILASVGFNKSSEYFGMKRETVWAFSEPDCGLASDRWYNGTLEDALNSEPPGTYTKTKTCSFCL